MCGTRPHRPAAAGVANSGRHGRRRAGRALRPHRRNRPGAAAHGGWYVGSTLEGFRSAYGPG
ncbi:MAG: hypothetical protein EOO80_00780 [Oxalobacteraceae bacterium]|nr:MAG: hypothetical protein EOO80_00780 [Oxalobacteraceae bacterium]